MTIIAFDVDGTLRDNSVDQSKPPVANESIRSMLITFSKFKNVKIMVWSGGGELYARQVVSSLGLDKYVDLYADKQYTKCTECEEPSECNHHVFATDLKPDIAIDDIQSCELGLINLIVREK